jgi:hypothetical protein
MTDFYKRTDWRENVTGWEKDTFFLGERSYVFGKKVVCLRFIAGGENIRSGRQKCS